VTHKPKKLRLEGVTGQILVEERAHCNV
jgi:hypothetical protein